jgi:uncharacterized alkaline shock family protein YloU
MDSREPPVSELGIARAIHAAVGRVAGVAEMSAGRWAESATYGPGEAVLGVAVSRASGAWKIEIHLIAVYVNSIDLIALADRVRRTAQRAVKRLSAAPVQHIHIAIDDLRPEGERP